jgi:hypothetical protein
MAGHDGNRLRSFAPECQGAGQRPLNQARGLFLEFEDRASDSPFVERVWRSHSERAGTFQSIAECRWEMVVSRHQGATSLIVRGPETIATPADCPGDGQWFAIRFKVGTFMPQFRPGRLRDRNDAILPGASSGSFWLNGSAWKYPNFENADTFVNRLVREGLISIDYSIHDALRGARQTLAARTAQRRFLQVTGLTHAAIRQIDRARRATNLLREGVPLLDVVDRAGYYDQAHLCRSLKRLIGQTPSQIVRQERQLSFLYNTPSE